MLPWVSITPFGSPVEPDEKMIVAKQILVIAPPALDGSQTPTIVWSLSKGRRRLLRILTPTRVSPYLRIGFEALGSIRHERNGWRQAMRTNWRWTKRRSRMRR